MKKFLNIFMLSLMVFFTACDSEKDYPPVIMGEIKGQGTAEDPYNVAKAIRVCAANGEQSTEFVYTAGYVVSGSIDTSYGNATFNIADSPDGEQQLILYRIKDFNKKNFSDASKVNIGDYVVVYAPLINFRGNTPETGTGGYLYSINGVVGSEIPEDKPQEPTVTGDPKGSGTASDPYNVAKALQVAVANGSSSDVSVYTEGYVIDGAIDTSYGNGSWTICDNPEGTDATIKVFRAKDVGDQPFTNADKVKKGDKIVVYAPIVNYMGNTPETNLGYLYSINGNTTPDEVKPDEPDQPSDPGVVAGSEADPFSVQAVIDGATGSDVWVKGYIVGWVNGSKLQEDARFDGDATSASNLLIADSPDVTDVSKCVPVQLPAGDVRNALNLKDNPGNYKRQVILLGNLDKYFSVAGLKGVSDYKFLSDEPAGPTVADGSETSPYGVQAVIDGATGSDVWVKGYIVGWVNGSKLQEDARFDGEATSASNMLIADSPDVTDVSKCVPVQLPAGDVRNALNLKDNPGNYKKQVMLFGNLEKYFSVPGLKGVSKYKLGE